MGEQQLRAGRLDKASAYGVVQRLQSRRQRIVLALALIGTATEMSRVSPAHAQQASDSVSSTAASSSDAALVVVPHATGATKTSEALPAVNVTGLASKADATVGYVAQTTRTATKTRASLLTNPQSVSVVTREQMDDQGAMTVDQALRYTSGVNTQDGTDVRFDQIMGRGFNMDAYLDGLQLVSSPRFSTPRIDPYLMEAIDVLHGPASVLYGQGSPAGLVNYISKLPTAQPYHELMLQIGNHNTYQVGYDFSGPVDKDGTILYRVTGLGRTAETQASAIKDQRIAIAPSLTIRPNRDTSLTVQAGYQRDPNGGLFNPVPASGTIFSNPNGALSPDQYYGDTSRDGMHRTEYWIAYQLRHVVNDTWSMSQNLRYLNVKQRYYQTSVTSGFNADDATVYMWGNVDRENYSQFQVDTHATAKYTIGPLQNTTLFGIDYQHATLGDDTGGALVGTLNLFDPDYSSLSSVTPNTRLDYSLRTVGFYAQNEAKFRQWVLTMGMREDIANTRRQSSTSTSTTVQRASNHAFTYRLGLAYEFHTGIAPYISYATSFAPVLGATAEGAAFKPTTGKQWEVGLRYKPNRWNGFFSLAAFDLTQNNVSVTDPNNANYSTQTGQVRSRGIEAEAHADLTESLKVIFAYTYLNQRNTSSTTSFDKRPAYSPRNSVSFWGDYTFRRGMMRNIGFGSGLRYVGSSAGDDQNTFTVPGRVLVDLGTHYDIHNWRLGINVSNLFDRKYISYCNGRGNCYWGATRTILGTARYQW